eukprot:c11199_g1_i2.p1 GENE.c11199_g1_i2~~c11199_g1_i2.p1  ORF type:complete len:177 (+),score=25.70 c11199_g1_i2:121-651(+)
MFSSTSELKDHLRQAGNVVFADVLIGDDGRSKGCGVAEFSTPEDAENAIRTLTDTELDGRLIFVREDRESADSNRPKRPVRDADGPPHSRNTSDVLGRQVFVGNLSFKTAWQELKDLFRSCGEVERADVVLDQDGRSKGFGLVLFASEQDAKTAIFKLHNRDFLGRPLIVHMDERV